MNEYTGLLQLYSILLVELSLRQMFYTQTLLFSSNNFNTGFFSHLSVFRIGKTSFIACILCLASLIKSFVLKVAPTLPLRQWDL